MSLSEFAPAAKTSRAFGCSVFNAGSALYTANVADSIQSGIALAREAISPSVLVLDDGVQSRQVEPDLALAVVDGATGLGNGLCLPAGPLRAPLAKQLPHVQAVAIVGDGAAGEGRAVCR